MLIIMRPPVAHQKDDVPSVSGVMRFIPSGRHGDFGASLLLINKMVRSVLRLAAELQVVRVTGLPSLSKCFFGRNSGHQCVAQTALYSSLPPVRTRWA